MWRCGTETVSSFCEYVTVSYGLLASYVFLPFSALQNGMYQTIFQTYCHFHCNSNADLQAVYPGKQPHQHDDVALPSRSPRGFPSIGNSRGSLSRVVYPLGLTPKQTATSDTDKPSSTASIQPPIRIISQYPNSRCLRFITSGALLPY